tara:strand:- start:2537 stop:3988 length:1452 start_codon:yes stop_codon:yes gene_type:complete
MIELNTSEDKLHEECGVFGIFGSPDASTLTTLGLHALQHRGQEGAGIVTFDGSRFHGVRRTGLVGDNFNKPEIIDRLNGRNAIGHVRYSTTGDSISKNIQPLYADLSSGGFACAHNGNLTNASLLRESLVSQGAIFQSTSDTETILQLVAKSKRGRMIDKLVDALFQIQGAYSLVILTNKKLIGVRDPYGIRPLVLGDLNGAPVLASETCALDIIGAKFVRDIENGEIIVISEEGVESIKPFPKVSERPCIFERIYFSRPDSIIGGKTVYSYRKNLGEQLAIEHPIDADVVIPVPDSGVPAALGFAQKSGIPFELGIIRNHYVGRTFIEPSQNIRQFGVKLKHSANLSIIDGKKIVLIDDSIVRGTTSKKIIKMMYEAGAKEVHIGIACPPITNPDFYGIDTPDYDELISSKNSIEEVNSIIGSNSLFYLSLDGTYKAMGYDKRNDSNPQFTDHCFTGDYPTSLIDKDRGNTAKQYSLLSEKN